MATVVGWIIGTVAASSTAMLGFVRRTSASAFAFVAASPFPASSGVHQAFVP